jgi:hypothetical protein
MSSKPGTPEAACTHKAVQAFALDLLSGTRRRAACRLGPLPSECSVTGHCSASSVFRSSMNVSRWQAEGKHRFTQILVMGEFVLEAGTHGYRLSCREGHRPLDVKVDLYVSRGTVRVR